MPRSGPWVADRFAATGARQPRSRAADLVAILDDLLSDQITGAGACQLTSVGLRAAIGTLLTAVTTTSPRPCPGPTGAWPGMPV